MAERNCTYQNPLVRDGVSQKKRTPEALDPDYVKVDERTLADLLRFVNHYAELLQYYGPGDSPQGDWQPFFERDMTSIIVLLTEENPDQYIDCMDAMQREIEEDGASYQEVRKAFKTLFDLIATLAVEIDRWFRESIEGYQFHAHLRRLITADLRPALHKTIAYYKGALVGTDLVDESYEYSMEGGLSLISLPELKDQSLHSIWIDPAVEGAEEMSWQAFYEDTIASDSSIYEADSGTVQARVREGLPEVEDLILTFISALQTTRQQVPEFVEDALERFSAHEPHMGLLVTFFRLFRHAQDQMNTLTRRHLDFYYERVLQLARNKAVPDQVHLIIELAKHVDGHKIDEGTLFKAGKDQAGKEVLYRATEDVVLNKATVEQLKSIYIDGTDDFRIYDKPVANSQDGLGTELENPAEGWKVFGESQSTESEDVEREYLSEAEATMQFSSVGFALSSPVLELAEGRRIITIKINTASGVEAPKLDEGIEYSDLLKVYATGPEGWVNLQEFDVTPTIKRVGSTYTIKFTVVPAAPAIAAYNREVHGLGYETSNPILKVTLANRREAHTYAYGFLKETQVDTINLSASVQGVKQLVLQNELGTLDPAKPFQPFGPSPAKGAAFYIGSREVFAKNLDSLSVRVRWHDYPNERLENYYNYNSQGNMIDPKYEEGISNDEFKAKVEILENGSWSNAGEVIDLFPNKFPGESEEGGYYLIGSSEKGSPKFSIGWESYAEEFSAYDVSLNRGFIRVLLDAPESAFGHSFYPRLLMKQLQDKDEDEVPVEPYTPKIKSIELDYSAHVTFNSTDESAGTSADQLYHIYPFGTLKVYEGKGTQEGISLLPQFKHAGEAGGDISHTGEFYIGISGLQPPQQISLLVKVAEGSGDPLLIPPDIHWFYLSEEGWKLFEPEDIVKDETNGLLDSGILRFSIPNDATTDTKILPGNQHWIKAAVSKNAAALCKVIDIKAQALAASFMDQENDPGFLDNALPASTIGKLKVKEAAVKKIEQPYASEGGKVAERDAEYYRRVNERLRHKDRGISVWDYERLILQQFPSVYKAKCINHSTYGLTCGGNTMDAEFAPGYVTVIVIPDLRNKNAFNLLEPRVSLNLLEEIKCYLKKKISVFAAQRLKVMNPLFEQVKVSFYVEFISGTDEGFYRKKLLQEITAFLSPWAFQEGEEISFGGSIHKSVILNFIEERSYVDFITDFRMDHYVKGSLKAKDVNQITASEARSVLASYHKHTINNVSSCVS
ncbi:baseplate J/gp47 family protein [Fodinibius salsisoli]|uniref:Baseplate J/gp47 family protein n=1 Tax=Fodinibius salsisoli TaxID=2820877 RepID=A0ABT3PQN4_9BACT|nr:baseplate J/gp47 family protein [Fodinibius salsisoli]MCW9708163.1 baseplate J/gp47 family protein [Fodinibius salsisoli]